MADDDWGFAPPAFDAVQAMAQMRRSLRDLRLTERDNGFELRGKPVLQTLPAAPDAGSEISTLHFKLARQLRLSPDWDRMELRSSADQRKLLDELKRRLARWEHED